MRVLCVCVEHGILQPRAHPCPVGKARLVLPGAEQAQLFAGRRITFTAVLGERRAAGFPFSLPGLFLRLRVLAAFPRRLRTGGDGLAFFSGLEARQALV